VSGFARWWREWQERRRRRLLRRVLIDDGVWHQVTTDCLDYYQLDEQELARLRELASLFLHHKTVSGAGGFEPTDDQRAVIAAVACLLILELDLDWFDGWHEVIVYPDTFVVRRNDMDEAGVVHEQAQALGGESWGRGPVVLSWQDIADMGEDGYNVILHEFAHKLDMRNGDANGMPPLHRGMDRAVWTRTFQRAFDHLREQIERGEETAIDPYGAETPGEFFAVASEEFFELPLSLSVHYPDLYDELRQFYRQDPAARMKHMSEEQ